ncbi:ATP-dependent nuclease [Janthinobacterium tructae]|uniref:ATP-dependent nuclease n=1 Tax=Janthinobacterium tructae TaxID=2590869 RepID=UPI00249B38F6|nr:AAA family ATPase [Janthinobacterium tructae]MDI3294397.1 AAA family ATPase [Janthinobacterium tructae]
MRVASISIDNFRGIKTGIVHFKRHTVLVGANNTGKSTIIEAITLLLGRDKLIRELTEHDFYGSNPQPADRIKLVATIIDFEENDPEKHPDWFRDGRAIPKWLNEKTGDVHPARESDDWMLCCQIAAQAYFDSESLSVEFIRYFHDDDSPLDPFDGDSPVQVPGRLIQQFGFFLVRANRTWEKVLSWGSELFRRTVQVAAAQPASAILAERDRLRNPERPIELDVQIAPLIANVNKELAKCLPSAPQLQLRLTNTDSKAVLDSIAAHFSTPMGQSVPAIRHGSGLISLQGVMLLLELGRIRAEAGDGFIMALEEPEIHVAPATQNQLLHRIQALSTQTFVTTHSPSVAAAADPTSVLLLRNNGGMLTAEPFLLTDLNAKSVAWERKLFQQMRVEVLSGLMHGNVLVPEGRADFYLLRIILRPLMLAEDWEMDMTHQFGLEVGLIPTEDAKVIETFKTLERVHDSVVCLVDGDAAGLGYIKTLRTLDKQPKAILRWNDGGMVEDIVGWILEADVAGAMPGLAEISAPGPQSIAEVVKYLKAKKVDLVAYETVADVVANNGACRARAAKLFSAIAAACKGIESLNFKQDRDGVWVFNR